MGRIWRQNGRSIVFDGHELGSVQFTDPRHLGLERFRPIGESREYIDNHTFDAFRCALCNHPTISFEFKLPDTSLKAKKPRIRLAMEDV